MQYNATRWLLAFAFLGTLAANAQEVCDNGVDDDGDGLIDLNDGGECICDAVLGGGVTSILPNASFEDYDCLPTSYSQLNCADGWDQATNSTSDYFYSGSYMPPWIEQPLPGGGNGCVGGYMCPDYMELIGGCLMQPMLAGISYSMNVDMSAFLVDNFLDQTTTMNLSDVNVTIYGFASCPPMPTNIALCPGNEGWTELGYGTYSPSNSWETVNITFTPTFDVQAIMIGPPCTLPADYPSVSSPWLAYFLYDNLTLNQTSLFGSTIDDDGEFYTNDLEIIGHPDSVANSYQWYYQGVALVGETDTILGISANALDTGWYQFLSSFDTACTIAQFYVAPPVCVSASIDNLAVSSCDPLNVVMNNGTDTTQVISYTWDFGDSSPASTAYEPSHLYSAPGVYDVTLSIVSDDYCPTDTTFIGLVTINQIPDPVFSADLLEGCIGMSVQFTNLTDTLTGTCSWNFGDGSPTSNVCDPAHVFNTDGLFNIALTVTSPAGCIEDTTISAMIEVYAEPSVSFTSDTIAGCTPLSIQFTNTTPAAQVGSVQWDLGNGVISTDAAPTGTYPDPGTYTVSLLVTHPQGCQAEVIEQDFITSYGHPVVSFIAARDSGCYPLEIAFTNTTDANFTGTCIWDFGDGGTGGVCDPFYTYFDAGVFSALLHVISPQNCAGDTASLLVDVYDHPEAGFVFGPQPTDYFATLINFTDSSSIDVVEWDWDFGEGGILGHSNVEDPALHFPDQDLGEYPVRLIVTNANTCTDTAYATVMIDGYYAVNVPNAFTPDGDGINDLWLPVVKDQDEAIYQLSVFDRWGQELWASSDPTEGWDGSSVQTGVYVWKLDTRDALSRINHTYYGHVSVLK
ncbi:MAG: PKD domain-containing protein [Flavobacteriales bacterium]|nr:PKD domain-containing protein [Flavobacteriales bacterium]